MIFLRLLLVLCIPIHLSGCGVYRQKQREAEAKKTQQLLNDSIDECRRSIPNETKQAIARALCINQAMQLIRPTLPFPDLLDQENAARLALAEKVQAGKITIIERDMQFAQLHSQLVAEEQRRGLASRSVSAAESSAAAAWQASAPVTCTRIGNTTSCY